jgi:succinoglycan biosynthesis transport protein ExoP
LRARKDTAVALSQAVGTSAPIQTGLGEEEESGPGISATQIVLMLAAYWKAAAIIAVSVIVLGGVLIKLLPKSYTATATLKVDSDIKDPLAGTQNELLDSRGGGYIATEIQLMTSSAVLLPVIDQLHLISRKEYIAGFNGVPSAENLRQWVKERLVKDLDIEQGSQGSLLINITATANAPILAADIANAVADTYLREERQRVDNPASERAKRYSEQVAELKDKVSAAAEQLAQFRQRTGIVDPTGAKNPETDALTTMENRLEDARNLRRQAEVKVQSEQAKLETSGARSRIDGLRSQLAGQQSQMAQLRTTLGPQHPQAMAATRQQIAAETQNNSVSAEADLAAAKELEQKLQQAVEQQRAKVLTTGQVLEEGNKYAMELESAQSVYKRALDGYDQIMFASAGHYTLVDLVSRAEPALKSTKPNKVKLFAMNILAALGLGLAVPLCYELFLNRRVRCRDDLERAFKVPVLIELGRIPGARPA